MSAQHTKGPWAVVRYGDGDSLVVHSSPEIRVCFLATLGRLGPRQEVIEANARLIAAAPELLEALQALVGSLWLEGPGADDCINVRAVQRAQEAIAKATGGAA